MDTKSKRDMTRKADLKLLKRILDGICRIKDSAIKEQLIAALMAVLDKLKNEALHSPQA